MRKMKYTRLSTTLLSGLFSIYGVHANPQMPDPSFHITGLLHVKIKTNTALPYGGVVYKDVSLHKVLPSEGFIRDKEKLKITELTNSTQSSELDYSKGIRPFNQVPGAVDLGMNNTPVLDQGPYGTCVTFATTAAIDAILGRGDFISQQCTLELTKALGNNYWNGAYYASQILLPLKKYGLIAQHKCNARYANPDATIALSVYTILSDKNLTAQKINYKYFGGMKLADVKAALNAKHRVTIGVGLLTNPNDNITVQGFDMIMNGRKTAGGLWACEQPNSRTNYCGTPNAGHEIIVIGYDDTQQLLKIRNSWNVNVGDNGDFYMTYKFFETMNGDGTEVY